LRAFSPDGKQVAADADKTASVLEANTGTELVRLQMNREILEDSSLAVAAETSVEAGSEIEITHISLDPSELIRDACSRLPRNLTHEEWDRYLPRERYRASTSFATLSPTSAPPSANQGIQVVRVVHGLHSGALVVNPDEPVAQKQFDLA
jgi:hypothetical protein